MTANKEFCIREWGKITYGDTHKYDKNTICISESAWQELEKYANASEHKYIDFVNSKTLRIKNYVGVISTEDGTQIEILPKTSERKMDEADLEKNRKLILQILNVVYDVNPIETHNANLITKKDNLHELLINLFLKSVKKIVKRGIRSDYHRIEAHERFLKGQLQLPKQINEPPHRQHLFHIEYDIFSADRAENRLIHSALLQVRKYSKKRENQNLIRELLCFFIDVPISNQYKIDFNKWQVHAQDRSMGYYQEALLWVKLILNQQNPFTQKGRHEGISFLLPMEQLFESYVAAIIKKELPNGYQLKTQERKHHLAKQNDKDVFQLKPDMVIYKDQKPECVLDTKWKCIDENARYDSGEEDQKKGIAQADMYQLFAYGKKYKVERCGLIYPQWNQFNNQFEFELEDDLRLSVVPFVLDDVQSQTIQNMIRGFLPNHN